MAAGRAASIRLSLPEPASLIAQAAPLERFFPVIRSFLFDMGNVLVHFSHDRMCQQMGLLCGRSGDDIRRLLLDSGVQWNFERGLMSAEDFHRRFQEIVGKGVEFQDLINAASDIFELNREIVPVLDGLKKNGYRLVLLSNTSVWHFEFIKKRFDVLNRFDRFVVSYEAGAVKPEPAIFEQALEVIHCVPQECFYTDDIPLYVEAGRKFGLDAEVFTDVDRLKKQLQVRRVKLQ